MTAIAIIQPHFLPFAGYFDLMRRADCFVYYDTVQFRARSWHCRTWIRQGGVAAWLSVPVRRDHGSRRPLTDMRWDDTRAWRIATLRRLCHVYGAGVPEWLGSMILDGPAGLVDWNVSACDTLAGVLGIRSRTLRASQLPPPRGDKQARLVALCKELGASRYVCGPGSRGYVRDDYFRREGIEVEWIAYEYAHRLQAASAEWVFPSIVDVPSDCRRCAGAHRSGIDAGALGRRALKVSA